MRRNMLSTTALVAVGLASVSFDAAAADKIKLGIGGYFYAFGVLVDQDDGPGEPAAGRRDHKIAREAEVHFTGSNTLDNGLQFGVDVQLEAETCADQIDESFIWVEGTFGRVELGSEDPATDAMYYGSPVAIPGVGLSTPDDVFASLTNSVATPIIITSISGDSEKITYFTPRFAGIQLGISYTPDSCEEAQGCGGSYSGLTFDNTAGQQSEIVEAAVNYIATFSGVDVALYGAYAQGDLEVAAAGAEDQEQWGLGGQFTVAGFTVGAAYKADNQGTSGSNTDRSDMSVGVNYATGPWTVGVEYVHSVVEERAGLGEDETDGYQLGATYALGPGITLAGGITYWDAQDNLSATASENEALEFVVGTLIEF